MDNNLVFVLFHLCVGSKILYGMGACFWGVIFFEETFLFWNQVFVDNFL
jgi:hypothetical protein